MKKGFLLAVTVGLLAGCAGSALATIELTIYVNPDKTAYIKNDGDEVAKWDGYEVNSENNGLDPAGWFSFGDWVAAEPLAVIAKYGAGALGMGEVPNISEGLLAELHGVGSVDLQPGDQINLGMPFKDPFGTSFDATWRFHTLAAVNPVPGEIVKIPEPSSLILGGLGLVGLIGLARRRRAG
jgi:hypothetical protein